MQQYGAARAQTNDVEDDERSRMTDDVPPRPRVPYAEEVTA